MDKQPRLDLISGGEAAEQLRQFPLPKDTGILHVPEQLTWPMIVPERSLLALDEASDLELTYGITSGLLVFEETFHFCVRVDYAYGEAEETVLFRLEWRQDCEMLETIAELGIVALANAKPPGYATREELAEFLGRVTTFVCELDPQEIHRLRVQLIRMRAQAEAGL